ncbi:MAG: lactonase family protein, partial [Chloroflexota bacterium]|nr:lactonase family protein [Chloroflexota bacterium]
LHATPAVDPSFLAFDPRGQFLFACSEGLGRDGGAAASFKIEGAAGNLIPLSQQPSLGGEACHLVCDPTGGWLMVANHEHGSVAVLPIDANGRLGPVSDLRQHEGSGPGPTQTGPHAHCVNLDLPGRRVLVADKGIDKVMLYQLDTIAGKLLPSDPPSASLHAGAAPRHIAFHPSGRYVYVIGEADMTITAFSYDDQRGALTELQVLPTLPDGAAREECSTAEVAVEPEGRFVYVSNRGHDSIAIFEIDQASGRLTVAGHAPTHGRTPRNFAIDPTGTFLYAANQNSDTIVHFRIDHHTGQLVPTGDVTAVGAPVCVLFS